MAHIFRVSVPTSAVHKTESKREDVIPPRAHTGRGFRSHCHDHIVTSPNNLLVDPPPFFHAMCLYIVLLFTGLVAILLFPVPLAIVTETLLSRGFPYSVLSDFSTSPCSVGPGRNPATTRNYSIIELGRKNDTARLALFQVPYRLSTNQFRKSREHSCREQPFRIRCVRPERARIYLRLLAKTYFIPPLHPFLPLS
ncbi:hypothetical protein EDB83DRAFT_764584 [Lactarius deliciosus]|nr:hypothetical protein EDB83DRAFT_764584 [Lactarius deliciosus]